MSIKENFLIGGRYRLDKFIARGGMQEVWAATDLSLERCVAVKHPLIDGAKKRFAQSAQLSARIRHPNVATALDYLDSDDGEFYVEELINGINLQDCIDKNFPRLDGDTTAHVLHHLAKGLAASHKAGVLHRDLKPSNIMVSQDLSFSTIKITDFGIAKLAEAELEKGNREIQENRTTGLSSTMLGAIPFLAPEVLRKSVPGAQPIGKPSDVWSLAAIGYWLLSGEYPFGMGFDAIPGIFQAKTKDWNPALATHPMSAQLVRETQKIINQCFCINPSDRPTVDDLVESFSKLCYLFNNRECGIITTPGKYRSYFFGQSSMEQNIMFHQDEVMAGGTLKVGSRVNYIPISGQPYPRAVSILKLKDLLN